MKIISHRGFWKHPEEKNTIFAINHSVTSGFGTETDVRDCLNQLVVSHDPPQGKEPLWQAVVDLFHATDLPLAVNIKADGLSARLKDCFSKADIDWFAFDMSGPETVRYAHAGLPYFTRHSDVEPEPILYAQAQGVWLDGFDGIWFDSSHIQQHLNAGKRVCIVSPDLHGRDPMVLWQNLEKFPDTVMLCTDMPHKAQDYFMV
jgi:hypothetical protein